MGPNGLQGPAGAKGSAGEKGSKGESIVGKQSTSHTDYNWITHSVGMKFYNNMQIPLGRPGVPGTKGDRGLAGK